MDAQISALERAFALANSGRCSTVQDIRRHLSAEGHYVDALTGPTLLRQLRTIMTKARALSAVRSPKLVLMYPDQVVLVAPEFLAQPTAFSNRLRRADPAPAKVVTQLL